MNTQPLARRHGSLFVGGTALVITGVALHLPLYFSARHHGYRLGGMDGMAMPHGPMLSMSLGMVVLTVGLLMTAAGLFLRPAPPRHAAATTAVPDAPTDRLHGAHWRLIIALVFAVAIDTQKPYTFTFILPSVAKEYGLSTPAAPVMGMPTVTWLPLVGIIGTVLGSFLWGMVGDRVGRRAALLFAAVLFVGTSVCGVMPTFGWNVAMCFVMGLGAGGMLPAAFALLAETMPTRSRGWVLVLVSGAGTALGFVFASQLASWAMPTFGWRMLWLAGLPTGCVLLGLSRWIPESPRHLLLHGREDEARVVLATFRAPMPALNPVRTTLSFRTLFARPFTAVTIGLVATAASIGVVTYGFLVWLPTNLASHGLSASHVTHLISDSALVALPVSVLIAWLYTRWSARLTLIAAVAISAIVLLTVAVFGTRLASTTPLLVGTVALILVGIWAATAVITPYSTEIYPTAVRARGAALTAGATKFGGVVALAMSVAKVAPPGLSASAWVAVAPIALGTLVLVATAIETRALDLEAIHLPTGVEEAR